jgi:hypothetical protein
MHIVRLLAQIDTNSLPKGVADQASINKVLSIVFGITASIALLMIVIGGLRYTIAHGDPNAVSQARKTMIYAAVGLIVSLTAFSIVTFVIKRIG